MAQAAETLSNALAPVSESIEWREVDGEIALFDTRVSECVALNEAGSFLWPSIAEGATRDCLVGMLVGRFGISTEQASTDVDAFVDDLTRRGFLEP